MPIYQYSCEDCDHSFTELLKYEEIETPKKNPCPSCGVTGKVVNHIGAPKIGYFSGEVRTRMPTHAREHFQRIKNANKGSEMRDYT